MVQMNKKNKEIEGLKKKISPDPLEEVLKTLKKREYNQDKFPYDIYNTMDVAKNQFNKIDFENKIVFIFDLLSTKKSKNEALADIEDKIDTTIRSYHKAIKTFGNNERHLIKELKTLERDRKLFINYLDSLVFACFFITH
jgi:cation transport regulator ChaC